MITPKSTVTLGFSPGVVHSMGSDTCTMTCAHHYSFIQSSFTTIKSPVPLPLLPNPCQPLVLLVSVVSPFPGHIIGIIRHVAFSDYLLSFRNMHLRFFHVFPWLESSCPCSTEYYSLSAWTTVCPSLLGAALAIRNKAVISICCALPFLFCFESFSPFQDTFNLFTSYFSSGL